MLRLKGGSYPLNRSNVEKHDHFDATGKVYLANSSVASPWKMLKGSKFDRGGEGGCKRRRRRGSLEPRPPPLSLFLSSTRKMYFSLAYN